MTFPFSNSGTVVAGGIRAQDISKFADHLCRELLRNQAGDVTHTETAVRFRSWVTIGGPLWGIGGGEVDFRESAASCQIRFTLSFVPLVGIAALVATAAALSVGGHQTFGESVGLWLVLSLLVIGPWYLVLPGRFARFLERCLRTYNESPAASEGS